MLEAHFSIDHMFKTLQLITQSLLFLMLMIPLYTTWSIIVINLSIQTLN
eukprot:gene17961-23591_t